MGTMAIHGHLAGIDMRYVHEHKYTANTMKRPQKGFSLIELMVAVAIVAIIAAVAIPSYASFQLKSKRSEAKTALLDVSARLEQYYSENKEYTLLMSDLKLPAKSGVTKTTVTSNGYYEITLEGSSLSTYYLEATPKGKQASDKVIFILDDDGEKFHYTPPDTKPVTDNSDSGYTGPNGWDP